MDSEQILLQIYKQQHYETARNKMQKIVITYSTISSLCGVIFMKFFSPSTLNVYAFAGAVILAGTALLLSWGKVISLNIASFSFMLYICFILIPIFWSYTGIMGSAPYISLIILVSVMSMFDGKILKGLLLFYLGVLFALTIYSMIVEIPAAHDIPALLYTVIAYIFAVTLISAFILSKLKKFEQMSDQFLRSSFRDDLTRLFNRNTLDMILEYTETSFREEKKDYILVMFDVDKFKEMNDEHGHVYGDIILRNVAKCISDSVRSTDFVVRYGGDEFLVVQTDSTDESMRFFIEKIEEVLEASCYFEIKVSASYGIAKRSECQTSQEKLELADKRLYEKKFASVCQYQK